MNSKPILIIPGEKKSIFFEIFFKSIKSLTFVSPLILIYDKRKVHRESIRYNFRKKIELIDKNEIFEKKTL